MAAAVAAQPEPAVLPVPGGGSSASEAAGAPRPWCSRCARPQRICVCSALPESAPLETRTRVFILIHPKEVQRPLGTVPLLGLCLRNFLIREGDRFPEPEEDPELHKELHADDHRCVLVCPGPEAEELVPAEDEALPPPTTLIFIDGRWPQAKAMVNRSVWLRERLPRVVIRPSSESGYVFRQQPGQGCLSTLEAVAEALLALEGPRGPALKAALLAPFRLMVKHQCDFIPDQRDKNADFAPEGTPERLFDRDAVLRQLGEEGVDEEDVHCIVRWGTNSVSGREVIVTQVMRGARADAKARATELSTGRPRGRRFWVLPVGKVPVGAFLEDGDGHAPETSPEEHLEA